MTRTKVPRPRTQRRRRATSYSGARSRAPPAPDGPASGRKDNGVLASQAIYAYDGSGNLLYVSSLTYGSSGQILAEEYIPGSDVTGASSGNQEPTLPPLDDPPGDAPSGGGTYPGPGDGGGEEPHQYAASIEKVCATDVDLVHAAGGYGCGEAIALFAGNALGLAITGYVYYYTRFPHLVPWMKRYGRGMLFNGCGIYQECHAQ